MSRPSTPQPPHRYGSPVLERLVPRREALIYAATFVILGALVQITDFDRLNAFSVRHLQPIAGGKGHPRLNNLADLIVSPGAPSLALLVIAVCAAILYSQGRRWAAAAWPATLAMAFLIEIVSKIVISQHRSGVWQGYGFTFDSSFPSGHMLRAVLVAGALSAVWPQLRTPLNWWCGVVAVCLLITGFHLPTDIVGGLLAGISLRLWAEDVSSGRPRRSRRKSPTSFSSSSSSQSQTAPSALDPQGTFGSR
jgi:membrane-associated phospholipid phosphatase